MEFDKQYRKSVLTAIKKDKSLPGLDPRYEEGAFGAWSASLQS